jgi:2-amino-1-hydroxyethylphosphonate dioxygenase (glycine-forming)
MDNHYQNVADEIVACFEKYGDQPYFGEAVSQLQHACQAAEMAINGGHDDEIILAAFLHDIGHLCAEASPENQMENYGTLDHESIGANYLRAKGFSETICKLVAAHVPAKRYLTFSNPEYYANLSDASKQTLIFQGGKMTAAEAELFEDDPLFPLYIRMRLWDEAAKDPSVPPFDLGGLKAKMLKHLKKN